MPRVEIPIQSADKDGLQIVGAAVGTAGDPANNHFVNHDDEAVLIVFNNDASAQTVTPVSQQQVDGVSITDPAHSIPAGESRVFRAFPAAYVSNGQVQIDVSDADLRLQYVKIR